MEGGKKVKKKIEKPFGQKSFWSALTTEDLMWTIRQSRSETYFKNSVIMFAGDRSLRIQRQNCFNANHVRILIYTSYI